MYMCVVVSIFPMYLELSHFDIGTHLTACHFIFPPFYWHIDYYIIYLPLEFVPDKKHVLVYIRRKTYLYHLFFYGKKYVAFILSYYM
jgi:hypothetical protein